MPGRKNRVILAGMALGRADVANAAVAMLEVVPAHEAGRLDGHPAGRIINNKTGADITWKSKGYALSDQEKAKLQAEAAEKLAQRAAEQDKLQEATGA